MTDVAMLVATTEESYNNANKMRHPCAESKVRQYLIQAIRVFRVEDLMVDDAAAVMAEAVLVTQAAAKAAIDQDNYPYEKDGFFMHANCSGLRSARAE
jgi:hypothetical protein